MKRVLFILLCLAVYSRAEMLSSESFSNYNTGEELGYLSANPAVIGYVGDWTDTTSGNAEPVITSGDLAYTGAGYGIGGGYHISKAADSSGVTSSNSGRVFRMLGSRLTVNSNTAEVLYLSWLFKSGDENAADQPKYYQTLALSNGAELDGRVFDAGISTGNFGVDTYAYRVQNDSNLVGDTGIASDSKIHLFVVKFELSDVEGADLVTLWLDPVLNSGEPSGGVTISGLDLEWDRLFITDFSSNSSAWDEIRWGTTFDDVTSYSPSPVFDRKVTFNTEDEGETKAIESWGLDTAWYSEDNIRRGTAFMTEDLVDIVRISFTPTAALVNGVLQSSEQATLAQRLDWVDLTGNNTVVCINEDSPTVDESFIAADGYVDPVSWAELIDVTTAYAQSRGRTVVSVAPFNEPDNYRSERLADMQTFYEAAGELLNKARFSTIRISGGNTLNPDYANSWYSYLAGRLDEGNTHQLAGTFDNYAGFFQTVAANGDHVTNDELHNVMEAMVGAEYGLETGIWWGTAERARGEFVKASDGKRLAYSEHRSNWTAASVYRAPDGNVKAFVGESERQAMPTSYRFVSTDRPVFYDGHGPQREYTVGTTGGSGYMTSAHCNAETVVNINWGDDVQPAVDGRYIVVNRKSGKALTVPGSSNNNGVILTQNTFTGALNQQWDIKPLSYRLGGDYSYFSMRAAHSGIDADVVSWSAYNDGGAIQQWDGGTNVWEQWYFEYVGDGYFSIHTRWCGKVVSASGGSTNEGAQIVQWEDRGSPAQQWRLIPAGAVDVDFDAPATPTGLSAVANAVSVELNWDANTENDLSSYTVLRSVVSGGPYDIIARYVKGTEYVDNTANKALPYYYVVKAVDESLNRSDSSVEVSAIPTGEPVIIARLKFDGSLRDSTNNGNNAVVVGATGYETGNVGTGCLVLDGTSAYAALSAEVADYDDITISTWVYWNGGSSWQRIFDFGNDTDFYMFLTPYSGNGTLRFAIKNGGSEQVVETASLATGTWVHLAVTLCLDTATLYVNGSVAAVNSSITIDPSDFSPVCNYIGKSQWPDPLYNGMIDDFRIYNYALSDEQLAAIASQEPAVTFVADEFNNSDGIELSEYTGESLANYINDLNGDDVAFSKEAGPEWLHIYSDGSLSGIPLSVDAGENVFIINAEDSDGVSVSANMIINIANVYTGVNGIADLEGVAYNWLQAGCVDLPACDGADLDGNSGVNIADFSELANNWLADETVEVCFRFNSNTGNYAMDSSVFDRTGELLNGPVWTNDASVNSLTFDGVDDYVVISDYKGISGGADRTCAVWVKTMSQGNAAIVSWGDDNVGEKWLLRVKADGAVGLSVWGGNVDTINTVNDGQWHHIVVVLDGVNDGADLSNVLIYIDGVLAETVGDAVSKVNTASTQEVIVGAMTIQGSNTYYYDGQIDDLYIYNRAIASQEVTEMYNSSLH